MCLESAQMLSTAIYLNCFSDMPVKTLEQKTAYKLLTGLYLPAHKSHPCTVWAAYSKENFTWLLEHFIALCDEYTLRFNKQHASRTLINTFKLHLDRLPSKGLSPFANCARNLSKGLDFTNIGDVTEAYKKYLHCRWQGDVRVPMFYDKKLDLNREYV